MGVIVSYHFGVTECRSTTQYPDSASSRNCPENPAPGPECPRRDSETE